MTNGFKDLPLPAKVKGYPTSGAPRWSTTIVGSSSGATQRNQNWAYPLHRYNLAEAVRQFDVYRELEKHWFAVRGPLFLFPFRDPFDCRSGDMENLNYAGTPSGLDESLGTGDGLTRTFQLQKTYTYASDVESASFSRKIELPVLASVVVLLNGLDPNTSAPALPGGPYTYTVSRPGGVVTFDHPLTAGVVATAGFLFDVPVRFESDDALEGIARSYRVGGFASLTLVEDRLC